jgi:HEAT repeat protein
VIFIFCLPLSCKNIPLKSYYAQENKIKQNIAALKDNDWWVRRDAAEALGEIGDARTVEPLIAVLKDKDRDVRWHAASALGEIGDARAVDPLIAAR